MAHRFRTMATQIALEISFEEGRQRLSEHVPEEYRSKHITQYACFYIGLFSLPDDFEDSRHLVSGVFEHVNLEIYRVLVTPYEEAQRTRNGNVPEYVDLLSRILR